MVNSKFLVQINDWLYRAEVSGMCSKEFVSEGASLLLRANRNKNMFNFIVKNWNSQVQLKRLIYELKKHSSIVASGVTLRQIEEMKPAVEAIGVDVEKVTEVLDAKDESGERKIDVMIGKRSDHDALPEKIQVLYKETYNILRKERSLHEKLKLLKDAKPCDRHELTIQLIELDKKRLSDWELYDSFVIDSNADESNSEGEEKDQENHESDDDADADAASAVSFKEISTARSQISKKIDKLIALKNDSTSLSEYVVLRDKLQAYYDKIKESGSSVTDKVIVKLKEGGISI